MTSSESRDRSSGCAHAKVDSHHHLWNRGGQTYLGDQFHADASAAGVDTSLYVECLNSYSAAGPEELRCVGETAFVMEETASLRDATGMGLCEGIVGYADMALGKDASRVLEAHIDTAQGRFRGVRYVTAWDDDPRIRSAYDTRAEMLLSENVCTAVKLLKQYDLSFDAWVYFHQLPELALLAQKAPETPIVVNHCGGPIGVGPYSGERASVFKTWREHLTGNLGQIDNVVIKFGGLAMTIAGFEWHRLEQRPTAEDLASAWRPYFDVCLDAFGAERVMLESNFPVDGKGCDYVTLWRAFDLLAEELSSSERTAISSTTARRVYKL